MLPFAYYLLKIIICSAVLFGYYWFLLRNKVFHAYNRFYLLAIVALSIVLPLIKFDMLHANSNKTQVIKMLQIVNAGDEYMDEIIIGAPTKAAITFVDVLPFAYLLVSAILLIMLLQMLSSIFGLLKKHEKLTIENIQFINTDAARGTPFSFFRYIFWNKQIDINSHSGSRIFKHEIAHVQERHSWDKMFINIVLIVFWSNPIFWLVRRELSMIHEFIADKKVVEDGDTASLAEMILHATFPQKNFYITNNFFYSPIKRRLMMLTKYQHPRMNYISRLLVLPLLVIVFGAFTIKIAKNISKENTTQKLAKKIIVVLDAGHGGQDAGAVNKDGIAEKDVALQLVKKIRDLNSDENLQIILSRDNDVYSDPKQKAAFAKAQNADLFISVHLDNGPKEKWNKVSGMSVFVAKDHIANSEKSKILASSIINSFLDNYIVNVPTTFSQRQVGVWILQANDFPSVLIEAGYLTNDKDLAYLQSEKGQEAFARNVLDAIRNYASANLSSNTFKISDQVLQDTIGFYKGKAVVRYSVKSASQKCTIFYADNTSEVISLMEARNAKLLAPPPPPPPPVAPPPPPRASAKAEHPAKNNNQTNIENSHFINLDPAGDYNGEAVLSVSRNKEDEIVIMLENNVYKKLTVEQAKKAGIPIPPSPGIQKSDKIFTAVEVEPKFPGGESEWGSFLRKNLKANIPTDEGFKSGTYSFLFKFIVAADGSLSDFSTENYPDSKTAKHCIEVLKNGPKWIPAKQNGHIVAAYRKQPITFVISEEMDEKEKVLSQVKQSILNKPPRGAQSLEF